MLKSPKIRHVVPELNGYNGVLLRLYCRFDSYRERSILSGNERKIIAVFFIVFLLTANQKMSISANRNEKL